MGRRPGCRRRLFPQYGQNRVKHTAQIAVDLIVPNAEHAKPFALAKDGIPLPIMNCMPVTSVLAPIDLDD
jgi:hypothetical protein